LPWWGNFGISHLDELTVEQGRELLIRLARSSGDTALADFLATDKGEARLRAINALAGGSPRIWMILSECLTVELLDELVPAVEALLEGLVPYYQQLLWDLSPVEQRLVRELADGPHQAATVAELAKSAGIEQRVAASTLGRLADIRWVRAEKVPELDKRSTWYRLREPMLRHHFHYRSATDQPLPLIVEILRAWYDPDERRAQLALAEPGSVLERFAAASLFGESSRFGRGFLQRDLDELQAEARTWVHGEGAQSRTPEAGSLIDLAVTAARFGPDKAADSIRVRDLDTSTGAVADEITQHASDADCAGSVEDRFAELLRVAAAATTGRTQQVLELELASWGAGAPAQAAVQLADLTARLGQDDPLALDTRLRQAWFTAWAGDPPSAREQSQALVADCARLFGPDDPDTLKARFQLAAFTSLAGDALAARGQFVDLAADIARVYVTVNVVHASIELQLAFVAYQLGEPVRGINHARAVLDMPVLHDTRLRTLTTSVIRLGIQRLLSGESTQPSEADDPESQLAATLQAAVAGSAEAKVRLPSELVEIVESLRASPEKIGSR
jgi:hypothetical protein